MVYITQRTDCHVLKSLDTTTLPAVYVDSFGVFGVPGDTNTKLDYPWGLASDGSNFYVCDKRRIVKLNSSLAYVSEYDTTLTIGQPYAIYFEGSSLYVVGMYKSFVRIEKLSTALASLKVSGNLNSDDIWFRPTGICRGFAADSFLISGCALDLFSTIETTSFSSFTIQSITGETTTYPELFMTTVYNSAIMHTNGDLYLNNGRKILRVNSSFVNVGDSDDISKNITALKMSADGSLLTYNIDSQTIVRYDENLNFVEDIYSTTGSTLETNAYDVMDIIEL